MFTVSLENAMTDALKCGQITQETYDIWASKQNTTVTLRQYTVDTMLNSYDTMCKHVRLNVSLMVGMYLFGLTANVVISNSIAINKFFAAVIN